MASPADDPPGTPIRQDDVEVIWISSDDEDSHPAADLELAPPILAPQPAVESLPPEYLDHDAVSDSVLLEGLSESRQFIRVKLELILEAANDLRAIVDADLFRYHENRIFTVGGPYLPRPAPSENPLVIIPAIRFSSGVHLTDSFYNKMTDRAVEAASYLITALQRPALIYPWIRIHASSKA